MPNGRKIARDVLVIIGYPGVREGKCYNLAGVLYNGQWEAEYAKQALPNYQVFDEQRYFTPALSRWCTNIKAPSLAC